MEERIRLLITCMDRPGIVAAVSNFLFERGANIVDAEQHSTGDRFFLRVEAELEHDPSVEFAQLAKRFEMDWRLARSQPREARRDPRLPLRPLPARPALALRAAAS